LRPKSDCCAGLCSWSAAVAREYVDALQRSHEFDFVSKDLVASPAAIGTVLASGAAAAAIAPGIAAVCRVALARLNPSSLDSALMTTETSAVVVAAAAAADVAAAGASAPYHSVVVVVVFRHPAALIEAALIEAAVVALTTAALMSPASAVALTAAAAPEAVAISTVVLAAAGTLLG